MIRLVEEAAAGAAHGGGRQGSVQEALLIGWHGMPSAPGHVFYDRLNRVLDEASFDGAVEELCQVHYPSGVGDRRSRAGATFGCCS